VFHNLQAFLKSPLLLDCKENPEHGLRFVLTFQPATSFLVPMDRCVLLAQQVGVLPPPPIIASLHHTHVSSMRRTRESRRKAVG